MLTKREAEAKRVKMWALKELGGKIAPTLCSRARDVFVENGWFREEVDGLKREGYRAVKVTVTEGWDA